MLEGVENRERASPASILSGCNVSFAYMCTILDNKGCRGTQALSKDAPTGSSGVCTTGGSARALTFSGAVMPFCLFLGCFLSAVCSVLGLHLDTAPPHWVVESEMLCSTRRLQVVWWLSVGNPLC